jgi:hypothetical protein
VILSKDDLAACINGSDQRTLPVSNGKEGFFRGRRLKDPRLNPPISIPIRIRIGNALGVIVDSFVF